ncbi:MAG: TIGR04283 family arsenosugar biosynthesis glycosyltransferase [Rhodobacter sp.]|nr:TIGR04283 family arsenosugar biosynthesis glycosyltransferase [Rhodobacter sp.]
MRAPVSIVIPTLNAGAELPETLASLGEGLQAGLIRELIISDGGSQDETLAVANAAGAEIIEGPAGRGGQLARGVAASAGGWLLVVHADTHLAPGWAEAVLKHLRDGSADAAYFRLAFRSRGIAARLVAHWANLRSRLFGLPYGDQGLLIPRALYDQLGGYPDMPLMEDVAMARALRGRLRPLKATALTSAQRYKTRGWLRRGTRNLITLARYLAGTDPGKLARDYPD